ncbi:hypothetical protein [Protaetiibacter mangrovi]|uniref:Cell envelope biogenesis protein OmpA n=1 Tax=Protaetiibacter mangrovi TaxID=2970926 RepID=A0ABT1ZEH7_9MICO|nr:hypothetical protein [Protaetiibacter mangrovi]MCS0499075.1 hypothetical protein [Protaetiibacter mangrovi]TPX05434.1 hypothetical protein FJ656_06510 [Schumannella luteola]
MTAIADRPAARTRTVALTVLVALAAVAIATSLLALAAGALGAGAFPPLMPAVFLSFALVGTLAALAGWVLVVRLVRRSRAVLRVLVPVLAVVSFAPDIALLALGFIPGTTAVGVVALMLMHLVVVAAAVIAGRRIAPAR